MTHDELVEEVARALMTPQVGTISTYWKNKAETAIAVCEPLIASQPRRLNDG